MQSLAAEGKSIIVTGVTNDYTQTKNSDLVVITSGVPRKDGMSRDDLVSINRQIVEQVTTQVCQHSPDPIIIVVSNPLDVMTYVAFKASKLPAHRVMGMAGTLDVARYKTFLAQELHVPANNIHALLLG